MIDVKVTKLSSEATLPTKAHSTDAAFDLYANCPDYTMMVPAHGKALIGTGIAVAIPEGYFGGVYARSGLASKNGIRPSNCVGVIDSPYRGEIMVSLHNDTDKDYVVIHGTRIAQLIIQPCPPVALVEVNELDSTDRGKGGFGSSGK